jgi:hypothetical protein
MFKSSVFFLIVSLFIMVTGCTLPAKESTDKLAIMTPNQVTREALEAAQNSPTPTSTPLRLPSATVSATFALTPTVTVTATTLSEEEQYLLLYQQAIDEGRVTECNDPSVENCPDEPLDNQHALLSLLKLPKNVGMEPLPMSSESIYDVSDPEVERWLELSNSQGNYPTEAYCRSTSHYVCPTKFVTREFAPEWLGIVILGTTPPTPCRDSFIDTDSPWVESLVCPMNVYRIGENDPRAWGAQSPISKQDWDVIKEKLLQGGS